METAVDALLRLGLQLRDSGCYAPAAKCLLAVCRSNALPATIATARLLLGQLLLDHTRELSQAKEHLTAAELILRAAPGNHLLRCETLDALARCYQHLGALPQQKEAYVSGLAVCREGSHTKDREALARWTVYFHFRLAEYSLTRDSAADALAVLQSIPGVQQGLTPTEQALQLLGHAFLYVHLNDYQAATTVLKQCHALLDSLPDKHTRETRQLEAHLLMLGVSLTLARGSLKDLDLDDNRSSSMMVQLQQLMGGLENHEWAYSLMPARQVEATVAMLQATAYRSVGKLAPANAFLQRAEQLVDQQLAELRFALEKTEGALNPHALWAGKGCAQLKVLILQQHALSALTTTAFTEAAQHISDLIGILQRFPTLMRDFIPSVQMLQGHYAHGLGELAIAASHFRAVLDCDACASLHPAAAATAALCELKLDSKQSGVGRAIELLDCVAPDSGKDFAAWSDKALHQLVSSLVALRQGDAATAKVQLARTLKISHNTIGNSQLVGVVLVALAPVQLDKGDSSGASALLDSAFTILRGIHDMPSVVACVDAMVALQERLGNTDKAAKHRVYGERKARELQGLLVTARAAEAHQLVLNWTPMQQ